MSPRRQQYNKVTAIYLSRSVNKKSNVATVSLLQWPRPTSLLEDTAKEFGGLHIQHKKVLDKMVVLREGHEGRM